LISKNGNESGVYKRDTKSLFTHQNNNRYSIVVFRFLPSLTRGVFHQCTFTANPQGKLSLKLGLLAKGFGRLAIYVLAKVISSASKSP
jgi:hypothetical protein